MFQTFIGQALDTSDPDVKTSAMQAALTGYQPLDSDLTAIAVQWRSEA